MSPLFLVPHHRRLPQCPLITTCLDFVNPSHCMTHMSLTCNHNGMFKTLKTNLVELDMRIALRKLFPTLGLTHPATVTTWRPSWKVAPWVGCHWRPSQCFTTMSGIKDLGCGGSLKVWSVVHCWWVPTAEPGIGHHTLARGFHEPLPTPTCNYENL